MDIIPQGPKKLTEFYLSECAKPNYIRVDFN